MNTLLQRMVLTTTSSKSRQQPFPPYETPSRITLPRTTTALARISRTLKTPRTNRISTEIRHNWNTSAIPPARRHRPQVDIEESDISAWHDGATLQARDVLGAGGPRQPAQRHVAHLELRVRAVSVAGRPLEPRALRDGEGAAPEALCVQVGDRYVADVWLV